MPAAAASGSAGVLTGRYRYPGNVLRVKAPWAGSLRLLGDRDRAEVLALCDRDPVVNVFVASRVRAGGLDPAGPAPRAGAAPRW